MEIKSNIDCQISIHAPREGSDPETEAAEAL